MTARILIIGLDGASPDLVQRWSSSLPNLSRLISQGAQGTLFSINPPRSVPAWYCFATGMNPAKIGVFGFSQRRPGTYDYTFANLTFCRAPTFWQWLNHHGIKTALVHVPGTYPPHPVDGVMVSGWPGPLNRGNLIFTFPAGQSRQIDALLGKPFEFLSPLPMRMDNDAEMLAERLRITREHGQIARRMLEQFDWQVGLVVFSPLDRASHQFWRHIDPHHPAHDPQASEDLKDALRRVYQECDQQVGRLVEKLEDGDTVFIISDHGFGPATRIFNLNEWLHQQGYLVLRKPAPGRGSLVGRMAAPLFRLNQSSPLFRRLSGRFKKGSLSNFLRDEYLQVKNRGQVRLNHLPVDWSRTRVYCPDEGALYVNLKGRDPQGSVQAGAERETLINEIIADLQNIRDPRTAELLPARIFRKEEIYSGPYLEHAPDLLVSLDGYRTEVMAEMGSGALFAEATFRSGTHTPEGLLIARGPQILAGGRSDAGLMDIAPTVLHMLGLPIPESADGRVLLPLFRPDSPARRRPVQTADLQAVFPSADGQAYADAEATQVEERLRDLGYLG